MPPWIRSGGNGKRRKDEEKSSAFSSLPPLPNPFDCFFLNIEKKYKIPIAFLLKKLEMTVDTCIFRNVQQ